VDVIMVSVTDSPIVIEAAFRAGVRDFFIQPSAPFGELYDALRRAHQMRNVPVVARRRPKVHRPPPAILSSTQIKDT
jgi:DNA-binding NarL/FixJ family response regulator